MTAAPTITVASYNMRKAIGTDRRRNPQRVLDVLHEIDADVVALQEADKRFGGRGSAVPHELIDEHGLYKPVHFGVRHRRALERMPGGKHAEKLLKVNTRNIGWHGNAILVKRHIGVIDVRGARPCRRSSRAARCMAELLVGDRPLRVVGMHLDLSGLWRRRQMRAILDAIASAAAENADGADGRHQRMARRRRLPQGFRRRLPDRADRPELPLAPPGRRARPDHRPQGSADRGGRRAHERRGAAGVGPSADLGAAVAALGRRPAIFRCAPALDRRADAHRLAIFDDRPPGDSRSRAA